MSEIIGTDVQSVVEQSERLARKQSRIEAKASQPDGFPYSIELARTAKSEIVADKKAALLELRRNNPDLKPAEAQKRIGISKSTYYTYLAELEANGNGRNN